MDSHLLLIRHLGSDGIGVCCFSLLYIEPESLSRFSGRQRDNADPLPINVLPLKEDYQASRYLAQGIYSPRGFSVNASNIASAWLVKPRRP